MTIYCVVNGEGRSDLDHIQYASDSREDAEEFARYNDFFNALGEPAIETLEVELTKGYPAPDHERDR